MTIDLRYIYIGKTTANKRLVKIGIAKDVKSRWRCTDRSIKGSKEYPVVYFKVINARSLETMLHRKYKHKQKDHKGSGATEWFELGFLDRLWLFFIVAARGFLLMLTILMILFSLLLTLITILL